MKGLDKLIKLIEEFSDNFKAIDETAAEMNNHAIELLKYQEMSEKINSRSKAKFESISNANCALRDQYDIIWNTSSILLKNIINQQILFDEIIKLTILDEKKHKKFMFRISMMKDSLDKVDTILKMIISRNNEIILIDYLLVLHNDFQKDILTGFDTFKADISVGASEIVTVSKKIIAKKKEGVDFFANFESIVNEKKQGSISLLMDLMTGLENLEEMIKVNVNTFFSQMADVSSNVKIFFEISESVFALLKKKEKLVKENLEKIAEIAVILSLEINNYTKVLELIELLNEIDIGDVKLLPKIKMMEAYVKIAIDNVDKLMELNHYMVEIFDSNVVHEEQSVELVEMDTHCAKNMKVETNRLYDFTLATRELVTKNLKYTRIISKNLERISSSFS